MRQFETGATRDTDDHKLHFDQCFSSLVMREYAAFILKHGYQADGTRRPDNNWKKGIPTESYFSSMFRHFMDIYLHKEGNGKMAVEPLRDALCALMFNTMGYLYEVIQKEEEIERVQRSIVSFEDAMKESIAVHNGLLNTHVGAGEPEEPVCSDGLKEPYEPHCISGLEEDSEEAYENPLYAKREEEAKAIQEKFGIDRGNSFDCHF